MMRLNGVTVREFNDCHDPDSGEFCNDADGGASGGSEDPALMKPGAYKDKSGRLVMVGSDGRPRYYDTNKYAKSADVVDAKTWDSKDPDRPKPVMANPQLAAMSPEVRHKHLADAAISNATQPDGSTSLMLPHKGVYGEGEVHRAMEHLPDSILGQHKIYVVDDVHVVSTTTHNLDDAVGVYHTSHADLSALGSEKRYLKDGSVIATGSLQIAIKGELPTSIGATISHEGAHALQDRYEAEVNSGNVPGATSYNNASEDWKNTYYENFGQRDENRRPTDAQKDMSAAFSKHFRWYGTPEYDRHRSDNLNQKEGFAVMSELRSKHGPEYLEKVKVMEPRLTSTIAAFNHLDTEAREKTNQVYARRLAGEIP